MNIEKYIEQEKEIYDAFLTFFDNEDDHDSNYRSLIGLLEMHKIKDDRQELLLTLKLISQISKNHHRLPDLFNKIEEILKYLENSIRSTFSDLDLFDIFKNNKRILLFLFEHNLITINEFFLNYITTKSSKKERNLPAYFYTEIKDLVDEDTRSSIEQELLLIDPNIFESYDQKRRIGENHSYICSLIREDLIEDFITYYTKEQFPLQGEIQPSIFETNSFLIGKKVTLIEYASFFGAVQIIKFLQQNGVDLSPSLWKLAIHGNNPNMIHVLEDDHLEIESYNEYLKEAIKCHHNDIANYFFDNFTDQEVELGKLNNEKYFDDNILAFSFHYYNFDYISKYYDGNQYLFYYACEYNYVKLYNILMETNKIDINKPVISNNIFSNKTKDNIKKKIKNLMEL